MYLSAQQVEDLASKCTAHGDIVRLLAYTGLRWGELAGLRVGDVDIERRRLHVRRAVTRAGGKAEVGHTKTRSGVRAVPLTSIAAAILGERIKGRGPDEWAVASPHGSVLNPTNWRRASGWNAAAASARSPAPFASLARRAGADLKLVSKAMGHSSIKVTADIYADLFDDELDDIADSLDALVGGKESGPHGPFVAEHTDDDGDKITESGDDQER